MAFDSWGVLPGLEEDEFVLAFRDLGAGQGEPFMRMNDPTSEEKIREKLEKIGVSDTQADVAIAKAKEEWKKSQ
jgi:hypothetical protein